MVRLKTWFFFFILFSSSSSPSNLLVFPPKLTPGTAMLVVVCRLLILPDYSGKNIARQRWLLVIISAAKTLVQAYILTIVINNFRSLFFFLLRSLLLTHFGDTSEAEIKKNMNKEKIIKKIPSSYAKIWRETNFQFREYPRSGSKAMSVERRQKVSDYNGQYLSPEPNDNRCNWSNKPSGSCAGW